MTQTSKKSNQSLNLRIKGMTCTSCEILIEEKFKEVAGVHGVSVSHVTGKCEIWYSGDSAPKRALLSQKLADTHYSLADDGSMEARQEHDEKGPLSDFPLVLRLILLAAAVGAVYLLFLKLDLSRLSFGDTSLGAGSGVALGTAFLFGLIASVSSCMAVVGGLVLAFSAQISKQETDLSPWRKFRPHIFFHIGRLGGYFLLGGALGYLGSFLQLSTRFSGLLSLLVALVMVLLALDILQVFPASRFLPKLPKWFGRKMHSVSRQRHPFTPMLFGVLTFFLPCGFTQSMQLYALSSGSFWIGAWTLFVFALGTAPALVGVGLVSSLLKGRAMRWFVQIAGVFVLVFGIINLQASFRLLGFSVFENSSSSGSDAQTTLPSGAEKQVVNMRVEGIDYFPSTITVQAGVPVEWHIDGTKAIGCTSVLVVPSLGISKPVSGKKDVVVNFTPERTGNIPFTCSMGMAYGVFNVVDQAPTDTQQIPTTCDPNVQNCI